MDWSGQTAADDNNNQVKVSVVGCDQCANQWWVRWTPETQPAFCCYSGVKFTDYSTPSGQRCDLGGRPL